MQVMLMRLVNNNGLLFEVVIRRVSIESLNETISDLRGQTEIWRAVATCTNV